MQGRVQSFLLLLAVLNPSSASDYVGRLGAADMKGGDPKLVGEDANVSANTDKDAGPAPASAPSEGASSDRPLSPGDPAPPIFESYVHVLEVGINRGSATYIGDGWFISAGHMLDKSETRVTKIDGKQYGGQLSRIAGVDISWYHLNNIPTSLSVASAVVRELKEGETLTCVGKITGTITGTVSYDYEFTDNSVWLSTPGHGIVPGDSGGGVFDSEGNLVGVLIGDDVETDHVFIMPLHAGESQLKHINKLRYATMQHPIEGVEYKLFSAVWCGPCRIVKQTVLPELEKFGYKVSVVDIEQQHELAVKYDVLAIPMWIIEKNGKEVGREVGGSLQSLLRQAGNR